MPISRSSRDWVLEPPLRHGTRGLAAPKWVCWFTCPGYKPGDTVKLRPEIMIGNRFQGRSWKSAFAALASFDRDGNGIVEAQELSELYLWWDLDGNEHHGQPRRCDAARQPALRWF